MLRWISTQIQRFGFKRSVAWGHVTNFEILGPLYNFWTYRYPLEVSYKGHTFPPYGS